MEKIDIGKIRGRWEARDVMNRLRGGGDDTIESIESIRLVAEKVNEIVKWINDMSFLDE